MLLVQLFKKMKHFDLQADFSVGREIIILFGPSGSGKTTILNCIAGLMHPDQGLIKLGDSEFFTAGKKPMPIQERKIGYVFQDFALFPHMTVRKNIAYGLKDQALMEQLIDTLGIRNLLDSYPGAISGGEKQRVALVRAIATKPKALLLDEPFSSLDQKARSQCQNELLRLHEHWNIPVILVTHDEDEARKLGNRILTLKYGKIMETNGTHK